MLKPQLLDSANRMGLSFYSNESMVKMKLTTDSVQFYDSNKQIREARAFKAQHYVFIVLSSILVLSLVFGTGYEVYK